MVPGDAAFASGSLLDLGVPSESDRGGCCATGHRDFPRELVRFLLDITGASRKPANRRGSFDFIPNRPRSRKKPQPRNWSGRPFSGLSGRRGCRSVPYPPNYRASSGRAVVVHLLGAGDLEAEVEGRRLDLSWRALGMACCVGDCLPDFGRAVLFLLRLCVSAPTSGNGHMAWQT